MRQFHVTCDDFCFISSERSTLARLEIFFYNRHVEVGDGVNIRQFNVTQIKTLTFWCLLFALSGSEVCSNFGSLFG